MPIPHIEVPPPAFWPPVSSLLDVAPIVTTSDDRWQAGIRWVDVPVGATTAVTGVCSADTVDVTVDGMVSGCADPFTVLTRTDCATVGELDRNQDDATGAFTRSEGVTVDAQFWESMATTGTDCNKVATDLTGSQTTFTPAEALSLMIAAKDWNGLGVIHIPAALVPIMSPLLTNTGGQLRDWNGNRIAISSVDGKLGPDHTTATETGYIFATGPVEIRRSPITILGTAAQSVDRAINRTVMVAARTYVVSFTGTAVAAQIQI